MKKGTAYETIVQELKDTRLPAIDVSEKVMGKIHKRVKHRPILLAAIILCFITAFSASAAILPVKWNGMEFSIMNDEGKNERIEKLKELIAGPAPTIKESLEKGLEEGNPYLHKTLTYEEAKKESPFTILRPKNYKEAPIRSLGAIMNTLEQDTNKVTEQRLLFHDFYEKGDTWMVVSQELNDAATKFLTGEMDHVSNQFSSRWEKVSETTNIIAMYAPGSQENQLYIQYKAQEQKVIDIHLYGNVSKEELIELAKAYVSF